jgi:hypothetical protein
MTMSAFLPSRAVAVSGPRELFGCSCGVMVMGPDDARELIETGFADGRDRRRRGVL